MKQGLLTLLLIFFIVPSFSQTFELVDGDTINLLDASRKKQGMWIIKATPSKNPNYAAGQKVAEGRFENSRKMGLWKEYHPNGKLKSEWCYKNERKDGLWKSWWNNGQKKEEGTYKDGELISKKEWNEDGQKK